MNNQSDSAAQAAPSKSSETPPRKKHLFLKILISVVVLIVVLVVVVQYGLGFIVRKGAQAAGPAFIGTDITIERAHVRPFFGIVEFKGMRVGPPESFKADVFKMDDFRIMLEPRSLLTDTIVIREIAIVGPEVTYELSGLKSNVGAIMNRLEKTEKKTEEKTEDEADSQPAKKVVIEQFIFNGARIRIASSATGGKGLVVPMPDIELNDIGKKSGGVTGVEAFSDIMQSIGTGIFGAVRDAALSVGGAAVDGGRAIAGAAAGAAGAAGKAASEAAGAAGKAAGDTARAVGSTAGESAQAILDGTKAIGGAAVDTVGNVGGAAIGGARAVGGAAVDTAGKVGGSAMGGAKAVGGAAMSGARAVGGAIGGLFGGARETNAPANTPD